MRAAVRSQLNLVMDQMDGVRQLAGVRHTVYPLFWLADGLETMGDPDTVALLQTAVHTPEQVSQWNTSVDYCNVLDCRPGPPCTPPCWCWGACWCCCPASCCWPPGCSSPAPPPGRTVPSAQASVNTQHPSSQALGWNRALHSGIQPKDLRSNKQNFLCIVSIDCFPQSWTIYQRAAVTQRFLTKTTPSSYNRKASSREKIQSEKRSSS